MRIQWSPANSRQPTFVELVSPHIILLYLATAGLLILLDQIGAEWLVSSASTTCAITPVLVNLELFEVNRGTM